MVEPMSKIPAKARAKHQAKQPDRQFEQKVAWESPVLRTLSKYVLDDKPWLATPVRTKD